MRSSISERLNKKTKQDLKLSATTPRSWILAASRGAGTNHSRLLSHRDPRSKGKVPVDRPGLATNLLKRWLRRQPSVLGYSNESAGPANEMRPRYHINCAQIDTQAVVDNVEALGSEEGETSLQGSSVNNHTSSLVRCLKSFVISFVRPAFIHQPRETHM